jgi:hypothetical protein
MGWIKWVLLAVAAYVAYRFVSGAAASYLQQSSPSGWGSGMVYGPGSSWGRDAYGYNPWSQPQSYAFGGLQLFSPSAASYYPVAVGGPAPRIGANNYAAVDYSPDGNYSIQVGW